MISHIIIIINLEQLKLSSIPTESTLHLVLWTEFCLTGPISVQPVSSNPVCQRLCSASSLDYIVPRTTTKFGDRAFSVAGLTVWNSLPESVRSAEILASFKRKLKTYLFNISF